MSWRDRLQHAFAVDPPGPAEPTEAQRPAVEWVCKEIARRRLTTPALIGLEMSRPLNWVASQGMHVVAPGVWAIVRRQTYRDYKHFATFLEQRGSVAYLTSRIEQLEKEFETREKKEKKK